MSFVPAVLTKELAAQYMGMSISTFERQVRLGELPKPRLTSERRVGWLRRELDEAAEKLPISELLPPENTGAKKPRGSSQVQR